MVLLYGNAKTRKLIMFKDLLEPSYGLDDSPEDNTRITQVILYFDFNDAIELKRLAKEVMKKVWPNTYDKEGNLSLLYLELLKRFNNEGHRIPTEPAIESGVDEPESAEDNGQEMFF